MNILNKVQFEAIKLNLMKNTNLDVSSPVSFTFWIGSSHINKMHHRVSIGSSLLSTNNEGYDTRYGGFGCL